MHGCYLGFDTSCYTTSVACCSSEGVLFDARKLLSVAGGERGLRQSEGLYQHIRQLPDLTEQLFAAIPAGSVKGIGCSFAPTAAEDSYMPVFLAGIQTARALSAALGVPLFKLNHQAGHIRAALIGNEALLSQTSFYALHLSGGTTDLLNVVRTPEGDILVEKIGCSEDLHAGQMMDRVGVALGCSFPAGPELEKMAVKAAEKAVKVPSSVRGTSCSLSGPESSLQRLIGKAPENEIAYGAYDVLARTIAKMFRNAFAAYGEKPVLMCGGVSSSDLFRTMLRERSEARLYWGENRLSSDNAVGIAAIACDKGESAQ